MPNCVSEHLVRFGKYIGANAIVVNVEERLLLIQLIQFYISLEKVMNGLRLLTVKQMDIEQFEGIV